MEQDPSKMYEFLEALDMYGHPEKIAGKKKGSNIRRKKRNSSLYRKSKKCDDQCVDCFLTFCRK